VLSFTQAVALKYSISEEDLLAMWSESSKMKMSSTTTKKAKSAYQNFSDHQRKLLKKEAPTMKFGEISKTIGARWKNLSAEDKKKWTVKEEETDSTTNSPATSTPSSLSSPTKKNYNDMNKSELLEICIQRGFKMPKSSKKEDIIQALEANGMIQEITDDDIEENKSPTSSSSPPTTTTNYDEMNKSELLEICAQKGIKIPKSSKKDIIIQALEEKSTSPNVNTGGWEENLK